MASFRDGAKKVQEWIEKRGIAARFIDQEVLGRTDITRASMACFETCLDRWLFESVREARGSHRGLVAGIQRRATPRVAGRADARVVP